jgi:hypothetical protein
MIKKNIVIVPLSILMLVFGCKGNKKCPYKPAPVFKAGLPHIQQYKFEQQGPFSLESLLLDTQVLLELEQDVCERTRQEYRFTVQGDYSKFPDSLWVKESVRQMTFLSTFSPEQAPLRAWASVIERNRANIRLGEDTPVEEGVTVRVDRIISPDKTVLRLVLAQQ